MNASIKTLITAAAVAAAALSAAGSASAQEYAGGRYDQAARYDRHEWRNACAATRWNPRARYMPGDVVRRHGEVYMARRVSARVWNVNSPPEWTPNYWAPARCR